MSRQSKSNSWLSLWIWVVLAFAVLVSAWIWLINVASENLPEAIPLTKELK